MPDLATHALISFAGTRINDIIRPTRSLHPATVYLFVLGNIFPDILDKTIPYALYYLYPGPIPFSVSLSFLHTPAMLLLCIYIFSLLFTASYRKRAFSLLFAGVTLHLILDLLQGNICEKGYMWFFPFSFKRPTVINLFYDDSTTPLIPLFIGIVVVVELIHRRLWKKADRSISA